MLNELESLKAHIEHINEIVAMQQNYATAGGLIEVMPITDVIEDALRMNGDGLARHKIDIIREYEQVRPILIEKHKVLQILVNLIRNAKHALTDSGRDDKELRLKVGQVNSHIEVTISDNGIGIAPENITRIFAHGFTTKKGGHGFGLHSGVLAAREMGGSLAVHSEGVGTGAAFALKLPLNPHSDNNGQDI